MCWSSCYAVSVLQQKGIRKGYHVCRNGIRKVKGLELWVGPPDKTLIRVLYNRGVGVGLKLCSICVVHPTNRSWRGHVAHFIVTVVGGIVSVVCCIVHRATHVKLYESFNIARSGNRGQLKLQLIPLRVFLLL